MPLPPPHWPSLSSSAPVIQGVDNAPTRFIRNAYKADGSPWPDERRLSSAAPSLCSSAGSQIELPELVDITPQPSPLTLLQKKLIDEAEINWCYTTNADLQKLRINATSTGQKQQRKLDRVFILLRRMRRVLARLSGMTEDEVNNAINAMMEIHTVPDKNGTRPLMAQWVIALCCVLWKAMNVNPRVTTHMTESSFNFRLSHFQKVVDMYKDSPDNRKLADANLDNNRRRIFDLLTKSAGKYDNSRLNNKLPVGFEGMVDGLKEQMAEFMKGFEFSYEKIAHSYICNDVYRTFSHEPGRLVAAGKKANMKYAKASIAPIGVAIFSTDWQAMLANISLNIIITVRNATIFSTSTIGVLLRILTNNAPVHIAQREGHIFCPTIL